MSQEASSLIRLQNSREVSQKAVQRQTCDRLQVQRPTPRGSEVVRSQSRDLCLPNADPTSRPVEYPGAKPACLVALNNDSIKSNNGAWSQGRRSGQRIRTYSFHVEGRANFNLNPGGC